MYAYISYIYTKNSGFISGKLASEFLIPHFEWSIWPHSMSKLFNSLFTDEGNPADIMNPSAEGNFSNF